MENKWETKKIEMRKSSNIKKNIKKLKRIREKIGDMRCRQKRSNMHIIGVPEEENQNNES